MRRNLREKKVSENSLKSKILISGIVTIILMCVIVFSVIMYQNKINNNTSKAKLTEDQLGRLNTTSNFNTESASSSIGKSIEEEENLVAKNSVVSSNVVSTNIVKPESKKTNTISNNTTTNTIKKETNQQDKKEITFQMPVEGEITSEFAKENLVYSETLKEWVTHNGIDIKADKTTIVKAASDGTVKTIKNDPRYGLTIVIVHDEEYETIYSNLLTAEFVVESEKVEAGQTIGTVGNTAAFEILDEPHLHFEIWKNLEAVDPTLYIK